MNESFSEILTAGGNSNSLGRTNEVIELVLGDKDKLEELYSCTFDDNAWVRMRAIDTIEKVCREYPDWLVPYIDRLQVELADTKQASILWHLAEIYCRVDLTAGQKHQAILWLKKQLSTPDVDWIVAANTMKAVVYFTKSGDIARDEAIRLLTIQQDHKSKTVVKTSSKLLAELQSL